MNDAGGPPTICVLGIPRGGISRVAGALALVGVRLGPDGYSTDSRLSCLNERVLRMWGGSWRAPPALPRGWGSWPQLDELRKEARVLLAELPAGREPCGWADPRNSLTLPFWQGLVPGLRYVLCLRGPLEVAASLRRRDGVPTEQGLALWRVYVSAALAATCGRPRFLVSCEAFIAAPSAVADGLARFVGCDGALRGERAARCVAEAVDEQLRRSRATAGVDVSVEAPPDDISSLHLLTRRLVRAQAAGDAR